MFSKSVYAATLPTSDIPAGTNCTVIGWGKTNVDRKYLKMVKKCVNKELQIKINKNLNLIFFLQNFKSPTQIVYVKLQSLLSDSKSAKKCTKMIPPESKY